MREAATLFSSDRRGDRNISINASFVSGDTTAGTGVRACKQADAAGAPILSGEKRMASSQFPQRACGATPARQGTGEGASLALRGERACPAGSQ